MLLYKIQVRLVTVHLSFSSHVSRRDHSRGPRRLQTARDGADGPLPVGLPATRPAVYSGHFSFDWCKVPQFCFLAGRAVSGRGELGV